MRDLTADGTGIHKLMRDYYKQLCEHRLTLPEKGDELLVQ